MKNYNKILEAINRGIKFALDDFEDNELQGQVNSKVKYQGGMNEYLDLMKEVVDLDLPSGTLWCKYNLDVNPNQLTNPEDWYGKYYAWGELEGNKPEYNWDNYKFGNDYFDGSLTKYCNVPDIGLNGFTDNLSELLPEDDAAYQNKKLYNFKFHIPTKEQFEELGNCTKNYWVNNYDPNKTIHNHEDDSGIQGLNGRVFEGKKNGNQLFIPAAGDSCENVGSACLLWSSSLFLSDARWAYYCFFNSNRYGDNIVSRANGFNIRPVINL